MFVIKADGREIYSSVPSDDPCKLLAIDLELEMDTAGSLSFTIPPGHMANNRVNKLKSRITMEWDGVEIFRGRVTEESTDAYNQKEVYCEGDLSYLQDSVQRPEDYSGTPKAYIERLIARHNSQVEPYKRFTLGNSSGITDNESHDYESDDYSDTLSAIRAVLEEEEAYLFTRYENDVRYLDIVASHSGNNGAAIEFGVNLVDLENDVTAEDFCTIMLPLGGTLDDGTILTIKSVNDDKDTIENTDAIAQYGRIVKTCKFNDVIEADELLEKAREKLDSMALSETLTLTAVDMHFLNESKGIILPGRSVLIHTLPHGINKQRKVCTAVNLDPENPEKATYTFGKPTKTQSGSTAIIASKVYSTIDSVHSLYKYYKEGEETAKIHTGKLNEYGEYISEAKIELDGLKGTLDLTVKKDGLISAINMSPESIVIDSSKVNLKGYVTIDQFEAVTGWADNFNGDMMSANMISAGSVSTDEISFGDLIGSRGTFQESLTYNGSEVVTKSWISGQNYANAGDIYSWLLERGYATQAWVTANFQAKS